MESSLSLMRYMGAGRVESNAMWTGNISNCSACRKPDEREDDCFFHGGHVTSHLNTHHLWSV